MTVSITLNGEHRELPPGTTLAGIVRQLPGEPGGRGVAVALDGEVVPRPAWDGTELEDGAHVEVVTAVQGG